MVDQGRRGGEPAIDRASGDGTDDGGTDGTGTEAGADQDAGRDARGDADASTAGDAPGDAGGDASADAGALPFKVAILADRETGIPGTLFRLRATTSARGSGGVVTYAWVSSDARQLSGEQVQLGFEAPGFYDLTLTATAGSAQVSDSIRLVVFDPAAIPDPPTPPGLDPPRAFPGALVQLRSPALDDPQAVAEIVVGETGAQRPFRPALGVANLLVPIELAAQITEVTTLPVSVRIDGLERDRLDLRVAPLPAASADPAAELDAVLRLAGRGYDALIGPARAIAADLGGTSDEQAALHILAALPAVLFADAAAELAAALERLDPASLAVVDRIALAHGLPDAAAVLTALTTQPFIARTSTDDTIDRVCTTRDVAKAVKNVSGLLSNICLVFWGAEAYLARNPQQVAALGALGPELIAFLGAANTTCAGIALADILAGVVDAALPALKEDLRVTANPGTLSPGETSTITVQAGVNVNLICDPELRQSIAKTFAQILLARIVGAVPSSRIAGVLGHETLMELEEKVTEAATRAAELVLSAAQLDFRLADLFGRLCQGQGVYGTIAAEGVLQAPSSGSLFFASEQASYTCAQGSSGPVRLDARRQCGGEAVATGSVTVTCGVGTGCDGCPAFSEPPYSPGTYCYARCFDPGDCYTDRCCPCVCACAI